MNHLNVLKAVIKKELESLPDEEKKACAVQVGFAKERPKNYYRGMTDAYNYVDKVIES